ncbi:MAG: Rid family hydrolase [Gammaproteobacteria bacterium]|nr:Rid family hydrolase [Gammaproteobacteria bacterium]
MKRKTVYPANHWSLQVDIPYSMGVQCGNMFYLCGQADLEGQGNVQNAGDLYKQTDASIKHIQSVVSELGCDMEDLTKLTVFYINNGETDESLYIQHIADTLDTNYKPVITMVSVPSFFYPGVMVEIDAYGMHGATGALPRGSVSSGNSAFSQAILCGEMIFIGSLSATDDNGVVQHAGDVVAQSNIVLEKLEKTLSEFGANKYDIVKINNWYVGGGTADEWEESARIRAAFYPEPGPAATGIPVHRLGHDGAMIQMDCWAMLGTDGNTLPKQHAWPEGHWDWPIHLPFKHGVKCGNMIFLGGQVSLDQNANVNDPGNMEKQTHTSMHNIQRVLAEFGADMKDIVKLNTYYEGTSNPEDLHSNVNVRSSYFQKPGPASTGIPFPHLAYKDMLIEIEVIAMQED